MTPLTASTARLRSATLFGVVAVAAGVAVCVRPSYAVAAVGAVCVAAAARYLDALPGTQLFAGAVVLLSGLVDLPRGLSLGPITGLAALTAAVALAAVILVVPAGAGVLLSKARLWFFAAFVGWMIITSLLHRPTSAGIQNLVVYAVFLAAMLAGVHVGSVAWSWPTSLSRLMRWATFVAFSLYGVTVCVAGIGGRWIITPRPFALFALVAVAWALAGWRLGYRGARAATCIGAALILLSLSRLAFAAVLVLAILTWLNIRTPAGWVKLIVVTLAVGVLGYVAVDKFTPLRQRVLTGDVVQVHSGVDLNVSGRNKFWSLVWKSAESHPYIGQGAGSADELVTKVYGSAIGHPHNDWLRIFHDGGIVGLLLWIAATLPMCVRLWRRWHDPQRPRSWRRVDAAGFLALVGMLLAMITDNVIIYLYVVGPVGVLVGSSLGLGLNGYPTDTAVE